MANSIRKQTDISDEEKELVLKRQNYRSISKVFIGNNIKNCDFHHVINSGLGEKGVGYEWNLVAITRYEHRQITDHKGISIHGIDGEVKYKYEEFISAMKNHLKVNYTNWSEANCKVHKGYSKEDYGVKRRESKLSVKNISSN